MLLQYIQAAMHRARYELLAEVLEDWMMLRLSRGFALHILDGLELRVREVAECRRSRPCLVGI